MLRACLLLACVLAGTGCVRSAAARSTGWWRVTTDHVQLTTDVDHDRAVTAAWAFEDLSRALSTAFPVCTGEPIGEPLEVTMLGSASEATELTGTRHSGTYQRAQSGLIGLPARLVVPASAHVWHGDREARYTQLFLREMTRRFTQACFQPVPSWLEDGMASFFETLRVGEHEIVIGIAPFRIDRRGGMPFLRDGISIRQAPRAFLEPPSRWTHGGSSPADVSAWAFVHMLELGPDAALRERFRESLEAMHAHRSSWLYVGEDSLDAAFEAYASSRHFLERRIPYEPPPLRDPIAAPMSVGEAALVLAAIELGRVQQADRGRIDAYLAIAREDRATATRAELLRVQLGELRAGETQRSVIDALVAAHPDDRMALVARAYLALTDDADRASVSLAALADRTDLDARDRVVEATLALELGDWDLALTAATEATRRDPGDVEAARAVTDAIAQRRRPGIRHAGSEVAQELDGRPGGGLTRAQWERRRPGAR